MAAAGFALALACAASPAAMAQVAAPDVERSPGNVELPDSESRDPFLVQLAYTGDILSSVEGGARRGTRWIHNGSAIVTADLDKLAGARRTTAMVHGLYNNGSSFSSVVGDAQVISSIETGTPMLRLLEAWIEHRGKGDRWSAKFGLYDVNSEFDALDTSLLFVHSAFGMGSDLGTSGRNGPSTFPATGLAVRGQVRVSESLKLRAAVADGVPGNPNYQGRLSFGLHSGEGAFVIGEADVALGAVRLLAGAWTYTAPHDDRFDTATEAGSIRQVPSDGAYVRGEAQLAGTRDQGLRGFVRLGVATGRANIFDRFASGGLVWHGLLPGRRADDSGIAIAYAGAGSASRDLARLRYGGAPGGETAIEVTHRIAVTDSVGLQPHFQYVRDPGLDPTVRDAVVLGLRLSASLAR